MSVTIDDLLSLAGRLDDEPGFDSPRERFRRFLLAHVTTPALARMLIEQCQHAPGEQHHRALQDLVVLTGRFLGFDTTFGSYAPLAGAVRYDGQWQSRTRLHIVVEVRRDHLIAPGIESLLRSASALTATSAGHGILYRGTLRRRSPARRTEPDRRGDLRRARRDSAGDHRAALAAAAGRHDQRRRRVTR